ncbi:MAG: alternative ribosome rescue aminoacyl-tRNA hydrolase ArfB [Planctomycetota bacterium]|nr:alternative ribosome rescue aminoacyl-tRNA hydrolase ArfB [Planctomycetota bacterium]
MTSGGEDNASSGGVGGAGGVPGGIPGGVEIAPRVVVPESELRFNFSRSSGPGGQNVNKLSTKTRLAVSLALLEARIGPSAMAHLIDLAGPARLTDAGDLTLVCEENRSQQANRRGCLERLRELLVEAMRPRRKRRATRPTRGSKQRRLNSKKQRGDIKRQRGGASHDA